MRKIPQKRKLTTKQLRFIELYDGNGVKAAREAGYKGNDHTLREVARENLRKPAIREAIQQREIKRFSGKILTRAERQAFWTEMMMNAERPADRLKASELLGKSQADFTERLQVDGQINITLVDSFRSGDGEEKREKPLPVTISRDIEPDIPRDIETEK